MSIGSVGILGYDDDQPQVAWDSEGLLYHITAQQTGELDSPMFDCSRFAGLHSFFTVSGNPIALSYQWFSSSTAPQFVAQRVVCVDAGMAQESVFAIANLGPYVTINMVPLTNLTVYTPTLAVMLTNREHPLTAYPRYPDLGQFEPASIAANATITQDLDSIFGGPTRMFVNNGGTAVTYALQYLDGTLAWQRMFTATVAAAEIDYFDVILPLTSCRWQITNNSGTTANTGFTTRCLPNLAAV